MYLSYIDESGNPDMTDSENEYVLASLTINESTWRDVDTRVRGLKQKYFPDKDPNDIEIHATDIFNHKREFKKYPLDKRLELFEDVMKIVNSIDCSISAVIIRKNKLINSSLEIDMFAMELLFERLCYYHSTMNGDNKLNGKEEQYGILLIDSVNTKYDNKIRSKVRSLFERGTKYEKNEYLIEDPIFVNSCYRHLSQLVDCVAYCIRRCLRETVVDEREKQVFQHYFDLISPKLLRRGNNPDGYGLKIFPQQN